jgi:hypothetical protein
MSKRACAVAVLVMVAACRNAAMSTAIMSNASADSAVGAAPMPLSAAREMAFASKAVVDRKVIQTSEIRIQLGDVIAGSRSADSIAAAVNGLVTSSHLARGDRGASESQVTMRVPMTRFTDAVGALRKLGPVTVDNSNAEDVGRAYNDLEIRIAVKRETVGRMRSLLANRTGKLADVIEVEREIGRGIAELEQMEGERRYLDSQIAMSTINVSFFREIVAAPTHFTDPILIAARQSIDLLGQSVAMLVSWLVFVTPWVAIGAIGWRVGRLVWRRRAPQTAPAVNT